jgi:putative oxidoreductase
MVLSSLSKYADFGLLIVRVVFGCMFIYYGAPKLFAGPQMWAQLGQAMGSLHINFAPQFWGFMAAFSMFFGGICLILGMFSRIACLFLFITMVVAVSMHFHKGDGLMVASHAIEDGVVFLSLIFIGPGKYSLDAWLSSIMKLR